jgi:hypothetical protein
VPQERDRRLAGAVHFGIDKEGGLAGFAGFGEVLQKVSPLLFDDSSKFFHLDAERREVVAPADDEVALFR